MARLITESFEGNHLYRFGNSLGINGVPSVVTVASQAVYSPGITMDGLYCMAMGINDAVIDMPLMNYSTGVMVTPAELFVGFFYQADSPDGVANPGIGGTVYEVMHRIIGFWSGSTGICTLRIDPLTANLALMDGAFYYIDAGFGAIGTVTTTTLAASTQVQPISANTLYHIQVRIKLDGITSIVQVKLDDVLVIDYTGPLNGGATTMSRLMWYGACTSYAQGGMGRQWFDDIVVNDTTTVADNSWTGIRRFVVQNVTGPGTYAQFTPVGDTPNWACIDDLPNDGDTTYNYALASNLKDSFPCSPHGLDLAHTTFHAWFQEAIARKTAGTFKINLGVRRAGVDYYSATNHDLGVSYDVYDHRLATDPSSLVAWTGAGLDATEIIYRCV